MTYLLLFVRELLSK